MLLHVTQSGRDIVLSLTDNLSRELYAKFTVVIRKFCIESYEFRNFKLLDIDFQYISKLVCGFHLFYLKRNVGKLISIDLNDFIS